MAALAGSRAGHRRCRNGWPGSGFVLIALGAAEMLAGGGALNGLWLALIGWFVSVAARQQAQLSGAITILHELTVADVISDEQIVVPASATIADVIERYVRPMRLSAFAVIDTDSQLLGLATVRRMADMPRER